MMVLLLMGFKFDCWEGVHLNELVVANVDKILGFDLQGCFVQPFNFTNQQMFGFEQQEVTASYFCFSMHWVELILNCSYYCC